MSRSLTSAPISLKLLRYVQLELPEFLVYCWCFNTLY